MTVLEQETTTWYGCYDGGWQNIISDLSFRHPAKFSRSLVSRIYGYALERGYLKPGMVVLDPFGGVGLGSLDALSNGLSWVGIELEKDFQILGQGCECTGISKADWVRFYGRWEKANYKDGRSWCPECLAEARKINPPAARSFTLSLFGDAPESSAAYVRNSGIVPHTQPHYYRGNLDLFRKYARPGTFAVLLNGDSRNLRSVIGQAQVDGLLSSPPYIGVEVNPGNVGHRVMREKWGTGKSLRAHPSGYGDTSGNLGNLPAGDLDGVISSPPYIQALGHDSGHPRLDETEDKRRATEGSSRRNGYGSSNGQLSSLPAGSLADSLLASPPFAGNTGGRGEASRNGIDAALFDRHSGGMKKGTGDDPGNLDHLPMRGFTDALVSSPPFENQNACNDPKYYANRTTNGGPLHGDYGSAAGQLGIEQGTTFWAAARQIVNESFLALKPGAFAFFVCKAFVRDGKRVDFPGQWQQLCEAVGFEYVETIRAMLVSQENEQKDLNGGGKVLRKEKKSFFRRLAEKNGSPRIDFEEVVILRKPNERTF